MKNYFRWACITLFTAGIFCLSAIGYVQLKERAHIYYHGDVTEYLPSRPIAIILGANIKPDQTPSDALYDRLDIGVQLYKEGKVSKLLLTGDDGRYRSNEIGSMEAFVFARGVTSTDVLIDGQGYRTYESCKRAKQVFGITSAYIVTQRFHLGRALYLCDNFGINSAGVIADNHTIYDISFLWVRDLLSSFEAWIDINIRAPKPPVAN